MSRFGGKDTPEEHAHLGTLDVNCGFSAGLSIAVALYHRRNTGRCSRPRTSLSACANLVQLPFNYDYSGRGPFNEPSGRTSLGYDPLCHFYETSGGKWIFLDSGRNEILKLQEIKWFSDIALKESTLSRSDFLNYMKTQFLEATAENWLEWFHNLDIAAAIPSSIEHIRNSNTRVADGQPGTKLGSFAFSYYHEHPGGRPVTHVDHYAVRPSFAGIKGQVPAEVHGMSTLDILKSLSYSNEDIEHFLEKKVASTTWGTFLPL